MPHPLLPPRLTSMEVNADRQRGPRHWDQGVRLVVGVQWDSPDPLVHRIQEKGAHT